MLQLDETAVAAMEKAEQEQQKRLQEEAAAIARQQKQAAAEALAAAEEAKWGKNQLLVLAGEVVVHGVQLMPAKLLGIIQEVWKALENPFYGSVTVTKDTITDTADNGKEAKLTGVFDELTDSVLISLPQLWEDCSKPECLQRMGMVEQVWVTLLQITTHEMTHAIMKGEGNCEAKAKDILTTLAQKFDLECPTTMDMGWLGHKLDEWYSSIENSEEELHKLQRQMRMEGVPYIFPSGKRLNNLRQWFRLYHIERREETAWDAAVSSLILQGAQPTSLANPHVTTAAATTTAEQTLVLPGTAMPGMPGMPSTEAAMAEAMAKMMANMDAMGIPAEECDVPMEDSYTPSESAADNLNFRMPGEVPTPPAGTQRQFSGPAPWEKPSSIPARPLEAPIETLRESTREVMIRAFMAIFGYCGWNGQGGYNDPDFVARTPISVVDIPHINNILVGLDTVVDKRKVYDQPTQGIIRGFVGKAAKLPQYSLHINNGTKVVRYSLIPQNPEKPGQRGQEAKSGQMFGWVTMPGEGGKSTYVAKISCNNGMVNRANMVFEKLV